MPLRPSRFLFLLTATFAAIALGGVPTAARADRLMRWPGFEVVVMVSVAELLVTLPAELVTAQV